MTIYQYYEILYDGSEGEPFDVSQKINAPTLKVHPLLSNQVKKYYSAPSINSRHSDAMTKKQLDASNLQQKGFTQYKKDTTSGIYYKSAGTDPRAPEQN